LNGSLNLITALVLVTTVCLLVFDYVWRRFSFSIRKAAPVAVLVWMALVAGCLLLFG
jgi:RsiW-degrading membrane proteinase PrsW (M82 family)